MVWNIIIISGVSVCHIKILTAICAVARPDSTVIEYLFHNGDMSGISAGRIMPAYYGTERRGLPEIPIADVIFIIGISSLPPPIPTIAAGEHNALTPEVCLSERLPIPLYLCISSVSVTCTVREAVAGVIKSIIPCQIGVPGVTVPPRVIRHRGRAISRCTRCEIAHFTS